VAALGDAVDLDTLLVRFGASQLGEEPGRALVSVLATRRGDHQQAAGAGDGDVEQAAFLG
jgi:hypothetical protein